MAFWIRDTIAGVHDLLVTHAVKQFIGIHKYVFIRDELLLFMCYHDALFLLGDLQHP